MPALLRGAADNVELHEVCGAAYAHGRARDDADDVAFANEAFLEEALFSDGRKAVNFLNIGNMARHHAPDQGHAAAGFCLGGEGDDGDRGAVAGNKARSEAAVREDGDQLHVYFKRRMAYEFGNGFRYLQFF